MSLDDLGDDKPTVAVDDADLAIRNGAAAVFLKCSDLLIGITFYLAMAILIAMVGLICTELVLVHLFHRSLLFMDDVVAELVAVFAFLAIGYCMRERALIRVELIYHNLGPLARVVADIIYSAVSLMYVGALTYYVIRLVKSSYANDVRSLSVLETPAWIPQMVMLIGAAILIIAILADLIRGGYRLRLLLADRKSAQ